MRHIIFKDLFIYLLVSAKALYVSYSIHIYHKPEILKIKCKTFALSSPLNNMHIIETWGEQQEIWSLILLKGGI